MLSEKWSSRLRTAGRVIAFAAAVIYLIVLNDKIDSMRSDIDSIQTDISSIEDGSCSNSRICP